MCFACLSRHEEALDAAEGSRIFLEQAPPVTIDADLGAMDPLKVAGLVARTCATHAGPTPQCQESSGSQPLVRRRIRSKRAGSGLLQLLAQKETTRILRPVLHDLLNLLDVRTGRSLCQCGAAFHADGIFFARRIANYKKNLEDSTSVQAAAALHQLIDSSISKAQLLRTLASAFEMVDSSRWRVATEEHLIAAAILRLAVKFELPGTRVKAALDIFGREYEHEALIALEGWLVELMWGRCAPPAAAAATTAAIAASSANVV